MYKIIRVLTFCMALTACATSGTATVGDSISLIDAINQAAEQIAGELPAGTRIAIVVFETENGNLSAFIIEELTGALLDRRIEVVNRQSLEYVEQELNFQLLGAVNDDTAKSVGKFLGADLVIIGQLRNLGSNYRFTANATYVETAASASVPRFNVRNDRELQNTIAALERQTVTAQTAHNGITAQTTPITSQPQATSQTAGTFIDRGIALANRAEFGAAITNFTEALRLNQNMPGVYTMRGRAYLASIANIFRIDAGFAGLATQGIRDGVTTEERTRIRDLALADFNQAIRLDPRNSIAFRERGRVYIEFGDLDRALTDFNEALRLNPNDHRTFANRGIIYHRRGNYDQAIADLTQAIRIAPNFATAYYNRGVTYQSKGDTARSVADYEATLRIDPNYTPARQALGR